MLRTIRPAAPPRTIKPTTIITTPSITVPRFPEEGPDEDAASEELELLGDDDEPDAGAEAGGIDQFAGGTEAIGMEFCDGIEAVGIEPWGMEFCGGTDPCGGVKPGIDPCGGRPAPE